MPVIRVPGFVKSGPVPNRNATDVFVKFVMAVIIASFITNVPVPFIKGEKCPSFTEELELP